jgi:DNA-directed RNA polymerase subunit RPC12/RpoP
MENTLVRTGPCIECGGKMLWTQNAWPPEHETDAAYRCSNGHVLDPALTRQCPNCGIHDTHPVADAGAGLQFTCARCGTPFTFPR